MQINRGHKHYFRFALFARENILREGLLFLTGFNKIDNITVQIRDKYDLEEKRGGIESYAAIQEGVDTLKVWWVGKFSAGAEGTSMIRLER